MAKQGRVRLMDVAEAAGVSIATASHAIAGRRGVSDAVAERVRDKARELGYVVNMNARALASGSTSMVGLIVHDVIDPYFAEISSSAIREAAQHGLQVQICQSSAEPALELEYIQALRGGRARGIIIAGSGFDDIASYRDSHRELHAFEESGGRVVVIGRHFIEADAVTPDNVTAGRLVAGHLLDLGHQAIGVIEAAPALTVTSDRLQGIREVFAERGLPRDAVTWVRSSFDRAGGERGTQQLLASRPDVTAVIALSDQTALGALMTLRHRGLRVPQDVSVISIDDVKLCADLTPSLTSARLHLPEIGRSSIQLLLEDRQDVARQRVVHPELVVRQSTAPPTRST